jgi:hypothetical protein
MLRYRIPPYAPAFEETMSRARGTFEGVLQNRGLREVAAPNVNATLLNLRRLRWIAHTHSDLARRHSAQQALNDQRAQR